MRLKRIPLIRWSLGQVRLRLSRLRQRRNTRIEMLLHALKLRLLFFLLFLRFYGGRTLLRHNVFEVGVYLRRLCAARHVNLREFVRLVGRGKFNRDRVDARAQIAEGVVSILVRLGCKFRALVAHRIDHHLRPWLPSDVHNVAAQRAVELCRSARCHRAQQRRNNHRDPYT